MVGQYLVLQRKVKLMYIRYTNYKTGMQLEDDDSVLMSLQEFLSGGKDLEDGEPPAEETEEEPDVSIDGDSEEEAAE